MYYMCNIVDVEIRRINIENENGTSRILYVLG